jgi:single-strand selective monofunctional uracil DNA glycosylase
VLRLKGQGGAGMGGAPDGDLMLTISFLPHPLFTVEERNVSLVVPVTPWEAALGAKITVPTGIEGAVSAPSHQHPKRLVQGFSCARSEVSGTRLWGWAKTRFGTAGAFFEHFFVYNYCPLAFMEASSRNRTPDKLPKQEREPLYAACDAALVQVAKSLAPEWVIGIGAFAEKRARQALESAQVSFGSILHPSPASPQANRGWGRLADEQLARYGL